MKNSSIKPKELGIGILGCGMIAHFHARAIAEAAGGRLRGVYSDQGEQARRFAEEYSTSVFDRYEAMLASPEIDVVSICTPSGFHASQAARAARLRKHVIVEKPLAITREQLAEVKTACAEGGVCLSVISQLRFSPAVRFLKRAIREGAFGKILFADLRMKYHRAPEYYRESPWRGTLAMDGGGALMNQGIHGIDLLLDLMGPVARVYGRTRTALHKIEVEDTAVSCLEFVSGAMGTVHAATSVSPGYPRQIEINGSLGSAILTEDKISLWDVPAMPLPPELFWEQTAAKGGFRAPDGISHVLHRVQIEDVIAAVRDGRAPAVGLADGKRSVEVVLAIYESAERGAAVELHGGKGE